MSNVGFQEMKVIKQRLIAVYNDTNNEDIKTVLSIIEEWEFMMSVVDVIQMCEKSLRQPGHHIYDEQAFIKGIRACLGVLDKTNNQTEAERHAILKQTAQTAAQKSSYVNYHTNYTPYGSSPMLGLPNNPTNPFISYEDIQKTKENDTFMRYILEQQEELSKQSMYDVKAYLNKYNSLLNDDDDEGSVY